MVRMDRAAPEEMLTMLPPLPARTISLTNPFTDQERRAHVDVHEVVPSVRLEVEQKPAGINPRVIDDDVSHSKGFAGTVNEVVDGSCVPKLGRVKVTPVPGEAKAVGQGFELVGAQVGQRQTCASLGKGCGKPGAETPPAPVMMTTLSLNSS